MIGSVYKRSCFKFLVVTLLLGVLTPLLAYAAPPRRILKAGHKANYIKKQIADIRFGTAKKEAFQKQVHAVAKTLNGQILGQEKTVAVLQDRLLQYIESFPNRTGEPVALNLIGLPGVGKTGMLKSLESIGLPLVIFNAQDYASNEGNRSFANDLFLSLINHGALRVVNGNWVVNEPLVVVIDELDKVPEIDTSKNEKTQTLIGTINSILSEGAFSASGINVNVSNLMLITTMNFSPNDIELFTSKVLGENKNFYDLSIDDFLKFDQWIRTQPSARYRVLSKMFRSNTVSRLAPNTVIVQPLSRAVYERIIKLVVDSTAQSAEKKSVRVNFDSSFVDFLNTHAIYAPSGARETIFRVRALAEQLINFGTKAKDPHGDATVDRPRDLNISIVNNVAHIQVTPLVNRDGLLKKRDSFTIEAAYDPGAKLFLAPKNLAMQKPRYPNKTRQPRVTKKDVLAARYPPTANISSDIYDKINSVLLGQKDAVGLVLDDMKKYLSRPGPATLEPSARILSGFPGIGKTELVKNVAEQLQLPVVKVNLQQFASDSPDTVKDFVAYLNENITAARMQSVKSGHAGKYILLLEELDKVFEVDPQTGKFVNRPIMGVIKDLLGDGQITTSSRIGAGARIDIRDAFIMVTMNFSVDRFGFKADPRLTSIRDVMRAWRKLSFSPMALKELLGTMFLPETVSRMMSRFTVMKPLDQNDFRELIRRQVERVVRSRLLDSNGRNVAKIDVELAPNYEKYLEQETVIPSEGGRYTVVSVQNKIASDLEAALQNLPRRKEIEAEPLKIILDYDFATSEVAVKMVPLEKGGEKPVEDVLRRRVALQFPSSELKGKIPAQRLWIAAHEFGHAYMGLRLGLAIENVVVVPPTPGVGGYVKFAAGSGAEGNSARNMIFSVYSALASRAFERIVMSTNPSNDTSVLDVTSGPSSDIRQATYQLYTAIYELGFDPQGGTIDTNFNLGVGRYASIDNMPGKLVENLGQLMRAMENYMVSDFLNLHPKEWYVEKILALARKGEMNGEEFTRLVGFEPINGNTGHLTDHIRRFFGESAVESADSPTQQRVLEAQNAYISEFIKLLREKLHSKTESDCANILQGA